MEVEGPSKGTAASDPKKRLLSRFRSEFGFIQGNFGKFLALITGAFR